MFSMATMELSTSIPMPSANPERDSTLSVMPVKYMHTKAATTLIGIEKAMMIVGRQSVRKINSTSTASRPPQTRF